MIFPYDKEYPSPSSVSHVLVYGDHAFLPDLVLNYRKAVVWTDTPLVDCNFPHGDNVVFVPASDFVKGVLENCEVKNVTDVIHKPLTLKPVEMEKEYDMVAVLTQPQRKGHESLSRVLRKLDDELDREVTLRLRVHPAIRLFFTGYKKVKVVDIPDTPAYMDFAKEVGKSRVMLFPSYVEGIGMPPIEATVLNQQVVMGNIDATREFVDVKSAGVTDVKLVRLEGTSHWLLYQLYEEEEYLDLLLKALEDERCCVPRLKAEDMKDAEGQWKKVLELFD